VPWVCIISWRRQDSAREGQRARTRREWRCWSSKWHGSCVPRGAHAQMCEREHGFLVVCLRHHSLRRLVRCVCVSTVVTWVVRASMGPIISLPFTCVCSHRGGGGEVYRFVCLWTARAWAHALIASGALYYTLLPQSDAHLHGGHVERDNASRSNLPLPPSLDALRVLKVAVVVFALHTPDFRNSGFGRVRRFQSYLSQSPEGTVRNRSDQRSECA